jgi:hypothetical protein
MLRTGAGAGQCVAHGSRTAAGDTPCIFASWDRRASFSALSRFKSSISSAPVTRAACDSTRGQHASHAHPLNWATPTMHGLMRVAHRGRERTVGLESARPAFRLATPGKADMAVCRFQPTACQCMQRDAARARNNCDWQMMGVSQEKGIVLIAKQVHAATAPTSRARLMYLALSCHTLSSHSA